MRRPLSIAAVPIGIAVCVNLFFAATDRLPLTGDEPHYLVMADGVLRDRTFDLRSAYAREGETNAIYGSPLPAPHVVIVNHRWGPYHEPGLAMIVALPFAVAGALGSRLALCLMAGLLPWVGYRFLRARLPESIAAWLAVGVATCVPIVFGAAQIYPDLLAGVASLALLIWLVDASLEQATMGRWALFWLAAGLLPWLNAKFLAATAALGIAAFILLLADARRCHRPPALATAGLALVGPLSLAAFHVWAFQTPIGPRGLSEVASPFGRAAMMFLGLHFDQAQGMFWQQPLLLLGVFGLVPFVRRQPALAFAWLLLYAALIVPNSLELARYGGGGPAGRFGWSAAWLWLLPMAAAVEADPGRRERWIVPLVAVALVYQAGLAVRWLPEPGALFPRLEEDLAARNSLFPIPLRPFLPSFYFWDFASYWTYPPNVAAYIATGALIGMGRLGAPGRKPSQGAAFVL
ncbi:MAG: hypothetical protein IT176_06020 [Acidobacteria bacterium]|nr:hypothetical protein [Acidobacteriota bacterium]